MPMTIQEFLNRAFHIDNNTSATIIITIVVFGLGQILISIVKLINSESNKVQTRALFSEGLEALIRASKIQARVYREVSDKISLDLALMPGFTKVSYNVTRILEELEFRDVYSAYNSSLVKNQFIKKIRRKAINKAYYIQANVAYINDMAYKQFADYLNNLNSAAKEKNTAVFELMKYMNDLDGKQVPLDNKEFAEGLSKIWSDDNFSGEKSARQFNRAVIIPLRLHTRKFKHLPLAKDVQERLMMVSYHYAAMYGLTRGIKRQLSGFSRGSSENIRLLKKCIAILN